MEFSNNEVRNFFFEHAKQNKMKAYLGDDLNGETEATFHYHLTDKDGKLRTYMSCSIEDNTCYCIELISLRFGKKDYLALVEFLKKLEHVLEIVDIKIDADSPALHIARKLFDDFDGIEFPVNGNGQIPFMWVKGGFIV